VTNELAYYTSIITAPKVLWFRPRGVEEDTHTRRKGNINVKTKELVAMS
jgi:hypothetical protein